MKNYLKYLVFMVISFGLAACSLDKMADKILPEPVKTNAVQAVDAVMSQDVEFFSSLKQDGVSDEDFHSAVSQAFTQISSGAEIRRDIVGVSNSVNLSAGEGRSQSAEVVYEVQTEQGFTLITLNYMNSDRQGTCCKLDAVNVQKHDSSPLRETIESAAKIGKIIGVTFLIAVLALIAFIIRRRKKKQVQAEPY